MDGVVLDIGMGVARLRSLWSSADAERIVARYAAEGVASDLALAPST
jgi:hypothetical protein